MGIISEQLSMKKETALIVLLVVIAAFPRLDRIWDHPEFLADQGSAGVIIYESLKSRTVPLVGPAVSFGQRPGTLFYYLVGPPLVLSNFNPVAPAIFFALISLLGVYVLFLVGRQLWGFWLGWLMGLLYAVSPLLVAQNRTAWNPAPIPTLVILLIFCFIKIIRTVKVWFFSGGGLIAGGLVQHHYTNIYTMGV